MRQKKEGKNLKIMVILNLLFEESTQTLYSPDKQNTFGKIIKSFCKNSQKIFMSKYANRHSSEKNQKSNTPKNIRFPKQAITI